MSKKSRQSSPKADRPKHSIVAFRKAQALAAVSPLARFEVGALDLGEDWEGFYDDLRQVRRVWLAAMLAEGCTYENDPDGEKLAARVCPECPGVIPTTITTPISPS